MVVINPSKHRDINLLVSQFEDKKGVNLSFSKQKLLWK